MRAILVTAERAITELVESRLQLRGHHCQSVGLDALDERSLSPGSYELLFLDGALVRDGSMTLDLEAFAREHQVTVIVLVDAGDPEALTHVVSAGASEVLPLPLSTELLDRKLRSLEARFKQKQKQRAELEIYQALVRSPVVEGWRSWRHDLKSGRFSAVSPAAGRPARYHATELKELGLFDLVPESSRLRLEAQMDRQIAQVRELGAKAPLAVVDLEWRNVDGEIAWRRVFFTIVLGGDGAPVELRGINVDITLLKATDAELQRSERYYRHLFEAVNDAIIVFRPDGEVILDVNQRACDLYGYARDELLGMSVKALTENVPRGEEQIERTLSSGGQHRLESVHRQRDGRKILVDINASVVDFEGRTAILSINRDITDLRMDQVVQRRREEALQHALKLEAIGRLASGVAHDFNNLVMVMSQCAAALQREVDAGSSLRPEVDDLLRAGEIASSLIRQLLAFSRGRKSDGAPIRVYDVVAGLETLLRRAIGEDIELVVDVHSVGDHVALDQVQLEQVLVNLVLNARDAIDGAGRIEIVVDRVVQAEELTVDSGALSPGDYVSVLVRDDGSGMGPETVAHVLEPFFTTKPEGVGTGLGLFTIKDIVCTAKGGLEIDTSLGQGTQVTVWLPLTKPIVGGEDVIAQRPESIAEGERTVLIVEDEVSLRRVLTRQITRFGFRVLEARDGVDALEILRRGDAVDVIVSDLVMPRMGGTELIEIVLEEFPSIEVIFMTGHANRPEIERVQRSGKPLLEKPFPIKRLVDLLHDVLS